MVDRERPLLRAYVDETGDRGTTGKSSRYFAMAAIVISDDDEHQLRSIVQHCRAKFGVPANSHLHWVEHVKKFSRRQYVAEQLAALPLVSVNYVIFEKTAIPAQAAMAKDHVVFYNYTAGLMLERILLTARHWPGGPHDVVVRFGHVRGFDHQETLSYFRRKQRTDSGLAWGLLRSEPKFVDARALDGLQAADMCAGMLNVALHPNELGGFEPHHLLAIRHQIRRSRTGESWGYGFKVMSQPGTMQGYPWWPADGL